MKVLLINPNTNTSTTELMLMVARAQAPAGWDWLSLTAARGAALIDNPESLALAADEVAAMAPRIKALAVDAVIVAAFGDPGLQALREALEIPVVGIGEAAMKAADALGLPFSVLTITPRLRESTLRQIRRYGCETHFNTLVITAEDAATTSRDHDTLVAKIRQSIHRAIVEDGSRVLVIGGGPVAAAAQTLSQREDLVTIQLLVAAIHQLQHLPASCRLPLV
ncbi:MAG: hypothetical protein BSR46_10625 [Candidatus Dactylopiibacterium carminicum]|nr:MAG: hypothetical protein BSR46_10625 [Candidatus Dactylopiibacterium carminicum]